MGRHGDNTAWSRWPSELARDLSREDSIGHHAARQAMAFFTSAEQGAAHGGIKVRKGTASKRTTEK
jgi:hypothetical protein